MNKNIKKASKKDGPNVELFAKVKGKMYRIEEGVCSTCAFLKTCEKHEEEPEWETPCGKVYGMLKKDINFISAQ